LDVGFLDDGDERLLGGAARLEDGGKVGALPELGDLEIDAAGTRLPRSVAIAVPLIDPLGRALAMGRARQRLDLDCHETLGSKGQELAHEVRVGALLKQFEQCLSVVGHRWFLQVAFEFATRPNLKYRRWPACGLLCAVEKAPRSPQAQLSLLHHVQGRDRTRQQGRENP
jgi:hypothetical protein